MPKRKPVEAAEPASVVAEPKKKTVRSAATAKPKSPAATAAHKHHTKNSTAEIEAPAVAVTVLVNATPAHNDIALLAYSYWEARGSQGGSPEQDWLRAESELLKLAQNR